MIRTLGFRSTSIILLLLATSPTMSWATLQNLSGPPSSAVDRATSSPDRDRSDSGVASLKVSGDAHWTNSYVQIRRGDRVKIRAWGRVQVAGVGYEVTEPDGFESKSVEPLVSGIGPCGLVAVIGDENLEYIPVGKEHEFTASRDGFLFFSLNQTDPSGNRGEFDVRITVGNAYALSVGRSTELLAKGPVALQSTQREVVDENEKIVHVSGRLDWTNTYLTVRRGDTVSITATGRVLLDLGGAGAGPDGTNRDDPRRLLPDRPTGSLIGVIGVDNNDFVFLGASGRFTAARNGLLFLGINEDDLTNNSGGFDARITVSRPTN